MTGLWQTPARARGWGGGGQPGAGQVLRGVPLLRHVASLARAERSPPGEIWDPQWVSPKGGSPD